MNVLHYSKSGQILFVEHIVLYEGQLLPPPIAAPIGEANMPLKLTLPDDFPTQDLENYYVKNGVVTLFPPKPVSHMEFDYVTGQWVDRRSETEISYRATSQRNALLAGSDWTQLPDVPLATKAIWAIYRQALRDITDQPGYPYGVIWPTPPTA
jgi:hypothetical protein